MPQLLPDPAILGIFLAAVVALTLTPGSADAHQFYGMYLRAAGDLEEALEQVGRMLAEREASHAQGLAAARDKAIELHGRVEAALGERTAAAGEDGAAIVLAPKGRVRYHGRSRRRRVRRAWLCLATPPSRRTNTKTC